MTRSALRSPLLAAAALVVVGAGWFIATSARAMPKPLNPGPPHAKNDTARTDQGTPVTIDVVANDGDTDGAPFDVLIVTAPANGTATVNLDATVEYVPAGGFMGTDSFSYEACDNESPPRCDPATVTVDVRASRRAAASKPVAADDATSTTSGVAVTIDVLANDTDPEGDELTVGEVEAPRNGDATANADGTVTYQSDPGFVGADRFSYTSCDPGGLCDQAAITVGVFPEDDGSGPGGGGDGGGDAGGTTDVQGTTVASTGAREATLLWVMCALAALGMLLISMGRRMDDPRRRPLDVERFGDDGFLIFRS